MNNIYQLTGDDILYGKRFPDAIANGTYRVDIYHSDGPGITFRYLDGTAEVIPERGAPSEKGRWRDPLPEGDPTFYQIPLRSLVQDHIPNLIFAGRMLDSEKWLSALCRDGEPEPDGRSGRRGVCAGPEKCVSDLRA